MRHDRISEGTNLQDLINVNVPSSPSANTVLTYNGTAWVATDPPGAAGGEANTASDGDSGGLGLTIGKTGVDIQFKTLNSTHSAIGIANSSGSHRVDISLDLGQMAHDSLSGAGSTAHSDIDDHIGTGVGVHGITGSCVGTTDTQTLSNKTINTSGNTLYLHSTRPFVLEDPSSTENLTWWKTSRAITISTLYAVIRGSGGAAVTFNVHHDPIRSAAGSTVLASAVNIGNTRTGTAITSMADATIPADSWIWVVNTAKAGSINEMAVTFDYVEDG